jgi:undecaprenyl-diphosphatase
VSTIDAFKIDAARRRLTILVLVWVGAAAVAVGVGKQIPGATAADQHISEWFAAHRSGPLDKLTAVFSNMASTFVVIGIAVAMIVVGALLRRSGGIAVLVIAMAGEVTMFLTITLIVDRARPDVSHLDGAPPTSSFPSGHVFATFVLWHAIAVLAVRQDWPAAIGRISRVAAFAMPVAVGLSRVYRGMHHPTDVLASLVLGLVWTWAVVVMIVPGEPTAPPAGRRAEFEPREDRHPSSPGTLRPIDHRA